MKVLLYFYLNSSFLYIENNYLTKFNYLSLDLLDNTYQAQLAWIIIGENAETLSIFVKFKSINGLYGEKKLFQLLRLLF